MTLWLSQSLTALPFIVLPANRAAGQFDRLATNLCPDLCLRKGLTSVLAIPCSNLFGWKMVALE